MIVICGGCNLIGGPVRVRHPHQSALGLQPAGSPKRLGLTAEGAELVGWGAGVLAIITATLFEFCFCTQVGTEIYIVS